VDTEQIAFELKLRDQTNWPPGFLEFLQFIVQLEQWSLQKTANGLCIMLPPKSFACFQGWLELRGLSPAEEEHFV
jgi:hypothetical protein